MASLSGLVESDFDNTLDDDIDMMPTPESNQENTFPVKKGKGKARAKAAASKFSQPKRRASGRFAPGKKETAPPKKAATKKAPLKERINEQQQSDTEEVDEFQDWARGGAGSEQMDVAADQPEKQEQAKKQTTTKGKAPIKPQAKTKQAKEQIDPKTINAVQNDEGFKYTPAAVRQGKNAVKTQAEARKIAAKKNQPPKEPQGSQKIIPETQTAPMDLDEAAFPDEDEEPAPESVYRLPNRQQSGLRQPKPLVARSRAGSASDLERNGSDAATRRKLGDMTRKFENLELRYRNLREVGIKDAETNFEKLKKYSEEKAQTANDLIASLKKEIASQKAYAQEARILQKEIASKDMELAKARSTTMQLSTSLSEVHNENKALQAKLAAARTASTTVESLNAKTPGSAVKGKGPSRTMMVGSAEAAQAAQVAQLKEDLYSDLTGLILRSVERRENEDVYDCIQTGCNGTLHFKLSVANDTDSKAGSYEDTEFSYTPRLDSNRDRGLLEMMPDYLSEEISFSRMDAATFYSRIVNTLTTKKRADK